MKRDTSTNGPFNGESGRMPGRGGVAANPVPAAKAGASVLAQGGNAMDALVAAALVCSVVRPSACGIGGYVGCGLVRDGRTGKVWSIDACGPAPKTAHERMFTVLPVHPTDRGINENEYGCTVEDDTNLFGPRSIAVPGQLAAMGVLHERWGRLPWRDVLAPAQRLLADGFAYEDLARSIGVMEQPLRRYPESVAYLMPHGSLPRHSDIFRGSDLEATLERLAAEGWRDFYSGQLGRQIADAVNHAGGALSREDMAEFEPRVTEPLSIRYHNASVHTAILPNGGLTALQTLKLLETLDLPTDDDPRYWHLLAESLKFAWRDRLRYLADPAFASVPQARLLSDDYAAGRTATLRDAPATVDQLAPDLHAGPGAGTLHLAAADGEGNLVSLTISQGNTFGSCFTVPGTGVILGHGMCRLDPRPGQMNSIAGGKRPLNNTAPLLIEAPDRAVAIGVPGGRKIVSVMARAAQQLIDTQASVEQVCRAARLHVEIAEPLAVHETLPGTIQAELLRMGHRLVVTSQIAGVMNGAALDLATGQTSFGSAVAGPDGVSTASLQTDYRQMGAAGGQ